MDKHRPINKLRLRKLIEDHTVATLEFSDDTLLVFIDEVGIGKIDEHHHPLFGMGGCAIMGKQYRGIIKNSWRGLKKKVFGLDPMEKFHATDASLKSLSDEKLSKVTSFFVESSFLRIGMFVDKQFISNLDDRFSWNKIVHAVAGALSRQIGFAGGEPAEKDQWIIELSDKLSRDLEICQINNATSYFLYHRAKQHLGHSYMEKERCEPGLEMADLILYVDRLVRLRELPPTPSWQELVRAMFCPPAKAANGWAIMEGGPVLYNPSTGRLTPPPNLMASVKGPPRRDAKS